MARLEHVNIAVRDGKKLADLFNQLFGWHIRWEGPSNDGLGYTHHVGTDSDYVALYARNDPARTELGYDERATIIGAYSHLGVVVDDFEATRAKVEALGFKPGPVQDYEPGRRFYFILPDEIEIEVVSYD